VLSTENVEVPALENVNAEIDRESATLSDHGGSEQAQQGTHGGSVGVHQEVSAAH
jgi:hypothetical protein